MTSHIRKWKEAQLAELKELAKKHKVVAIADINMFPSGLFQLVRKKLHNKAVVKVSKARVVKKALEGFADKKALNESINGSCAVIFTEMNPFELYAFLKKNKGKIVAKAGAIAEEDIVVPAGDTGLPPGPALSDLKAAGLKVAVQGPTISITFDKVVTKAGEAITPAVASILSKLNIKPFKVGLKVIAVAENGQIFMAEILDIDTDKVFAQFVSAHRNAFNLAVNSGIANKETIVVLLGKAFTEAKAVAKEAKILAPETVGDVLGLAEAQGKALKGKVKEASAEKPEASEAGEGKADESAANENESKGAAPEEGGKEKEKGGEAAPEAGKEGKGGA